MSEEEAYCEVDCCECGIKFKFAKKIEEMWRKSGKTFHCPNGHNLAWSKDAETAEAKELKKLKIEHQALKEKLEAVSQEAAKQKKRADDLAAELEIWQPSTTEENKAG